MRLRLSWRWWFFFRCFQSELSSHNQPSDSAKDNEHWLVGRVISGVSAGSVERDELFHRFSARMRYQEVSNISRTRIAAQIVWLLYMLDLLEYGDCRSMLSERNERRYVFRSILNRSLWPWVLRDTFKHRIDDELVMRGKTISRSTGTISIIRKALHAHSTFFFSDLLYLSCLDDEHSIRGWMQTCLKLFYSSSLVSKHARMSSNEITGEEGNNARTRRKQMLTNRNANG